MNFLPFETTVLISELSETQIIGRLDQFVTPYKWAENYKNSPKLYFGKLSPQKFCIWPIIKEGRNSFIPILNGKIKSHDIGSEIIITMRLHFSVMIFLAFILVFVTYSAITHHDIGGLLFLLFVYIMTVYFFNEGCKKAKKDLLTILKS